jgi:hypothetical protein
MIESSTKAPGSQNGGHEISSTISKWIHIPTFYDILMLASIMLKMEVMKSPVI